MCLLIASCKKDDLEAEDCTEYHWEYEGASGPGNWATCFTECKGQSQSPIDIKGAVVDGGLNALDMHYEDVPVALINNGHTVEFEYGDGSTIKFNGEDYDLLQFHFHTGSEHTVDGLQYPMEVHLVHQEAATGNLAVVGIFFKEGSENAFLANFIDSLPAGVDDHYSSAKLVNVADVLPVAEAYYTYSGSLTTPSCSEVVTWLVLKNPVEASSVQIQKMHEIIHDNNRPIQSLNGREILEFN